LDRCLRRGNHNLAQRFFNAAAKPIRVGWQIAVGGDLALPEVEGPRPLAIRLANKYMNRVQIATETDLLVAEQFLKVVGLTSPPASFFKPSVAVRVATANRGQRRARQRDLELQQAGVAGRADGSRPLPDMLSE